MTLQEVLETLYKARVLAAEAKALEAKAKVELDERGITKGAHQAGQYVLTVSEVAPSPGKVVTPDMVGTRIGERAGYAKMSVVRL